MAIESMRDLILYELRQTYGMEQRGGKALEPDLLDHIYSPELRAEFAGLQTVVSRQLRRVEQIFSILNQKPEAAKAPVAETLMDDMKGVIGWKLEGYLQDAGLIWVAQQYCHILIANYGTMRAHAPAAGLSEIEPLLTECLEEVAQVDEMFTRRAEADVNVRAADQAAVLV